MANAYFNQFLFSKHKMLVEADINFIVDATNGNGLGIRSLKGTVSLIQNVFMHTSAAFTGTYNNSVNVTGIASGTSTLAVGMPVQGTGIPAGATIASIVSSSAITLSAATTGGATTGSITYQGLGTVPPQFPGVLGPANPNPASGLIIVQFAQPFVKYYCGNAGFVSPSTGGAISISGSSVLTIGNAYTIASVGTSTTANWAAVGLPVGITPAVGVTFIASATGSGTGTGTVVAEGVSGIDHIEVLGDPNTTITQLAVPGTQTYPYMMMQCLDAGSLTAPNNNTVIGLQFFLSNSSS